MDAALGLLMQWTWGVLSDRDLVPATALIALWFWVVWPGVKRVSVILDKLEKKLDLDMEGK